MENHPLIHILADFDEHAPETPVGKALLHSAAPGSSLIFTHQPFKKGDIVAPSYFLKLIVPDFPPGTYHLLLLHTESRLPEKYILAKHNDQYFFAPDNGLLPLAFGQDQLVCFKLPKPGIVRDMLKEVYLPALSPLVKTGEIQGLEAEDRPKNAMLPQPTITGNTYRLTVIYNDSQGNAYLNFSRTEFEKLTASKQFTLKVGMRETIDHISDTYRDVPEGAKLALFGLGDMLQIAINCGSALQYLGLKTGQMVMLEII